MDPSLDPESGLIELNQLAALLDGEIVPDVLGSQLASILYGAFVPVSEYFQL